MPSLPRPDGDENTTDRIALACRAVLFDCDGVLVDDASVIRAWSRWATDQGLDPACVLPMVHGRRAADTVALLTEAQDRDAALRRINAYEIEDVSTVTAVPGALGCVSSIPAGAWAVVTSATTALARARLQTVGIAPDVLVTADSITNGKPAPDGWLLAAEKLGVPIGQTVVVEDSGAGVQAARSAGASKVVGIGTRALQTDADVVVEDFTGVSWVPGGLQVPTSGLLRSTPELERSSGTAPQG